MYAPCAMRAMHAAVRLSLLQAVRKGHVAEVEVMITRLGIDVNLRCKHRRGTLLV